ncbi:toxin coregulated pilus biosynthesis protein TcpE [Vibrio zhanjiangensis]|uniref:Toxin coregulated pilus biosynthesis protein TcpE n=1 Tax=Vibrio zhanjiangensis TaxID=1046128 RepID=A0ABQ6F434_9VIBR|nr:type II secretion system F family protein [Vibrio zhanjiangensis]GLT19591.1 toxin coregulated pilus biosynthesis protein TcpE [Vibrio zhanjiangensis]
MLSQLEQRCFGRREQRELLEQWLLCLEDGLTIRAFCALLVEHETGSAKKIGQEGLEAPGQGKTFTQVLSKWCDPVVIAAIDAAEQSGQLLIGVQSAIDELDGGQNIMGQLAFVMGWPLLVLIIVGVLGTYVSGEILLATPTATGLAGQLRDMVIHGGPWFIGVLFVMFVAIGLALPRWSGPMRAMFDRWPLFYHYRLGVAAQLLRTLANLSSAGMTLPMAMKLMIPNASPYMRWHLNQMHAHLSMKANLGQVVDTGLLLPKSVSNLKVLGDNHQQFSRLLKRAASHHSDMASRKLSRLKQLLPKTIILVSVVLLATLLILSMFQLLNSI